MNGTEPKIEIFKQFGDGFELMKGILFQPFNLKKWLVIGFAGWLANFCGGGGGFNYGSNRGEDVQKINAAISQIPQPMLILGTRLLALVPSAVRSGLRHMGSFTPRECLPILSPLLCVPPTSAPLWNLRPEPPPQPFI
jgi:hypothetical protein